MYAQTQKASWATSSYNLVLLCSDAPAQDFRLQCNFQTIHTFIPSGAAQNIK